MALFTYTTGRGNVKNKQLGLPLVVTGIVSWWQPCEPPSLGKALAQHHGLVSGLCHDFHHVLAPQAWLTDPHSLGRGGAGQGPCSGGVL